ncbi:hypothetical protein BCR36DRAFT_317231 [Piromyces finnis]|uniref:CBM10 domain-containing protein n=1 Tax=Piromyces finnis TaxID=1754191 RepID=A0A1Y1VLE9_9FUNG|nr:hypothetical protein BCR36DRAFT_317231 [Piromyces finnis]|eukprot:ORX59252.1 hypothetical protein BCR36DRAFT_317231 [Piromyces finnis]
MNFKNIALISLSLFANTSFAYDAFFGNVTRAELFERTDFAVPKITINLSNEDYNKYFLTYKCLYDMNIRHTTRNEECYTADWSNLNSSLKKAIKLNMIDSSNFTAEEKELVNNKNITLSQFESIVTKHSKFTLEKLLAGSYGLMPIPNYETENAGLTYELDGDVKTFPNIKFSVGGRSTKQYEKLGFNIKIKKGKLYDRKQIRLRTEAVDPSFIREKLIYDMANILEIPSLSLNYCKVYFNDKFMGFYAMRDSFKSQWIEYTFGEKDTKHLYECEGFGSSKAFNCVNDDDDLKNTDVDFNNFLAQIDAAKTKEDLEEFFDVETFLKWQAIRYLIGGWDHVSAGQNAYLYMFQNKSTGKKKWIPLLYDFDNDLGSFNHEETQRTFEQDIYISEKKNPLYKILGIKDASPEVVQYMDEIMKKIFNPNVLFPRIDQIRDFIDPYVKEDRTDEETGKRPGRVARNFVNMEDYYTYEDFLENTQYTNIMLKKYLGGNYINDCRIHGIKLWILERFRFICSHYDVDCSYAQEYLNSKYESKEIWHIEKNTGCLNSDHECCVFPNPTLQMTDQVGNWGIENNEWCLIDPNYVSEVPVSECWSLSEGYPCCKDNNTPVKYVTPSTGTKYGIENGEWCGIIEPKKEEPKPEEPSQEECWSLAEGYPCCKDQNTPVKYESKTRGVKYGIENGDWCGLIESKQEEPKQEPTQEPTEEPTEEPTQEPAEEPTQEPTEEPTEEPTQEPTQEPTEEPTQEPTQEEECWSLAEGYPCCKNQNTPVKYESKSRGVKYGIENGNWCGIIEPKQEKPKPEEPSQEECWSLAEGYPCCKNQNTPVKYESKSRGVKYGIENGDWCGIIDKQ